VGVEVDEAGEDDAATHVVHDGCIDVRKACLHGSDSAIANPDVEVLA
jgi:hypothetical protein